MDMCQSKKPEAPKIANTEYCLGCPGLLGTLPRCPRCGKSYRKGPSYSGARDAKIRYLVLVRGEFQGTDLLGGYMYGLRIRPLVWKADGGFVYFPCLQCGEIQKIYRSDIARSGRLKKVRIAFVRNVGKTFRTWVNPCTHCPHCNTSTWVHFEGIAKEAP